MCSCSLAAALALVSVMCKKLLIGSRDFQYLLFNRFSMSSAIDYVCTF
jgi:hypothetical protein